MWPFALEVLGPVRFKCMPRVTITVPDKIPQPYRFQLDRQSVMIGRGSENDIVVDCGSITLRHAEMMRVEGGYELRDLGSTNGIKLDGRRCEVIPLRSGATVKLGDVAFDFQLSDEEREALAREKVLEDSPILKEQEAGEPAAELPAEARSVPKRPLAATSPDGGGGGFMKFLLLLLFVLVAFFVGLSIRHSKETGRSLFEGIQQKTRTLKANSGAKDASAPPAPSAAVPETPMPAAPETPAPTVPETPMPATEP